jgi:hypothetical protein
VDEKNDQIAHHTIVAGRRNPKELWPKQQFASHTVALQLPQGKDPTVTSFVWEFHPVLGEHYVRTGMKQTFVQLALPILAANDCFGTIRIRTYWRRFDQKSGVARDVISESMMWNRECLCRNKSQVGGLHDRYQRRAA